MSSKTGCVTSCRRMMSSSCFYKKSSRPILGFLAMPLMLRVANLLISGIASHTKVEDASFLKGDDSRSPLSPLPSHRRSVVPSVDLQFWGAFGTGRLLTFASRPGSSRPSFPPLLHSKVPPFTSMLSLMGRPFSLLGCRLTGCCS